MASAAERKRRQRARTAARTVDNLVLKKADADGVVISAAPRTLAPKKVYVRRETGLNWLRAKNKISEVQRQTGEQWGALCRERELESAHLLKSCLDVAEGRGGGTRLSPGEVDYVAAEAAFRAKHQLALAQLALMKHEGMIAVLDAICWKQMLPSQITGVEREAEDITTTLRLALDLVAKHWATLPNGAAPVTA